MTLAIFKDLDEQKFYTKTHKSLFENYPEGSVQNLLLKFVYAEDISGTNPMGNAYEWVYTDVNGQFFVFTIHQKPSNKNSYGKSHINFLHKSEWFHKEFFIISKNSEGLWHRISLYSDAMFYVPYIPLQITGVNQSSNPVLFKTHYGVSSFANSVSNSVISSVHT